ncbi:hypothetical protein NP233_g12726 [Leucocoprinus birnbaumii]|uniref:Uncharacterized protein n=1 Tax=Leucocoprinus birnbaumii TaxID=56174 RepID=A0AAD5VFX0_9AGAR|nr:hypothetical protein NP233_g12726 [Leucocoprinus birnbaumii]
MERYNVLQKKLEDLERVHLDGKKNHQAETDRLKSELSRCQKTAAEQSDRIDKQRKHNDALEARMHDLKKAAIADQSEIKSLKAKLKAAECDKIQSAEAKHRDELQERDKRIADLEKQLAGKQSSLLETNKTSQATEAKLRDDLRERDKRLADLKTSLDSEVKKRESLQQNLRSQGVSAKQAETRLAAVQQELSDARESFAEEREEFIARLENHKYLLSHAAEQYGKLAATTVPSSTYSNLKRLHHASQLKVLRLERKLGNTEDQVKELAHLIRQINDCNDLLKSQLHDAHHQLAIYEIMLSDSPNTIDDLMEPEPIASDQSDLEASEARLHQLLATYYDLRSQQLVLAYTCIDKDLTQATSLAKQRSQDLTSALASHEAIAATLETTPTPPFNAQCSSLENQVTSLKDHQHQTILDHQAEIQKDKDTVQRLTNAVQRNRMAEDALRAEIDRLLSELADAERYQEAYTALSEQVNSLLARNQLAEEEAERLAKFNTEILGHNNPAQRISYVDRIRRELAEAKHKIIVMTREQENMVETNTDLQHELDMYKSVADKQRTHITRVQRVPLSNVTRSLNASAGMNVIKALGKSAKLDPIPGDMTVDELM